MPYHYGDSLDTGVQNVGRLFAFPIRSLYRGELDHVILFHPWHGVSEEDGAIVDSVTAKILNLEVGKSFWVTLTGDKWHDLLLTVGEIVKDYPIDQAGYNRMAPPTPFIWAPAWQVAREFEFDENPLWSSQVLSFTAADPSMCYPPFDTPPRIGRPVGA